jgi:sugar phosphate isomerase/epimerase
MSPRLWAESAASPRISVQLYSVRDDCAKDFDAALAQVAKMGFAGVEFAGYHKYSGKPKELRKALDDLNLIAAGTHIGTGSFRGDELKRTIEFHQIIGCKFLCVPGDRDFTNPEKSKALAEFFNQTAAALKPLNMYCGYHNHTHEFTKVDNTTYWHLFAERTSKDVVLQQDCGWSAVAGYNPADLIKLFPDRTKITHFKPSVLKGDTDSRRRFGGLEGSAGRLPGVRRHGVGHCRARGVSPGQDADGMHRDVSGGPEEDLVSTHKTRRGSRCICLG